MRTGNVKAFCNRAQNAFSSLIYFWTQSQWRRQLQVSCLLYFISTASYMKSFDEVFGLTASFTHQMQPRVGFHISIRHKHVSEWVCVHVHVCGWSSGCLNRKEGGSLGGGDIKASGNRIPSFNIAGHGVWRQRKRDLPCDCERHACLPQSGSIQLFTHSTLSGPTTTASIWNKLN